jgi:hypothetical protein
MLLLTTIRHQLRPTNRYHGHNHVRIHGLYCHDFCFLNGYDYDLLIYYGLLNAHGSCCLNGHAFRHHASCHRHAFHHHAFHRRAYRRHVRHRHVRRRHGHRHHGHQLILRY